MNARRQIGFTQEGSATAVKIGTTAASTAVTGAAAAGWMSASAAGPIGAGIALVGLAITALIANSGCGPTCVLATGIVNDLEPQLKANRDVYLATPNRTTADQAAALANFDAAFSWLRSAQACGAAELHDAGRRCISDRDRGGKWDWFSYYRDPIAADRPPASSAGNGLAIAAEQTGFSPAILIAAAAVILGATL